MRRRCLRRRVPPGQPPIRDYRRRMPARPPRSLIALIIGGVLMVFVFVVAQLATSDGLAQTIFVTLSALGGLVVLVGIVLLVRFYQRQGPHED